MSNHIRISHLIGKPALGGGWIIPRPPGGRVKVQLEEAERSTRTVLVRIRPDFPTATPVNEVQLITARLAQMCAATGGITATMNHGEMDPSSKRYRPETRFFKVGETYELSPRDAFRLLGAKPYQWAFEEVIPDNELKPLIPETTASASSVNELQEKVRYLEGLVQQMAGANAAAASKQTKKRTLKDIADADKADGDEG
jgi:hypothetical protein